MNRSPGPKSPRQAEGRVDDSSNRGTGIPRTNEESDDDDVLMDDDDREEKTESSDESEEEARPNAQRSATSGESESDEKDTTMEDDDDDSTVDDSDSSETSNTPGDTSLTVDEIDQLIRDHPTHFVPPPRKLPDLAKIAASAGVLSSHLAAKIAEEEVKPDVDEESTPEVEKKEVEEVFDKKPQKNASVVPVPTTFFSPKQMRRIMAHVTSLHDIRISHPSVKAVSIAMEHFIRTFIQEAYRHAQRSASPRTVVDYEDLSYVAQHFTSLYFLQDFVPPAQTANVVLRTLLENDGYDVDTDLQPPSRTNAARGSTDAARKPGSFNFSSRAPLSGSKAAAAPVGLPTNGTPEQLAVSPPSPVIDEEESDDPELIARRRALLRIARKWDGAHVTSNWRNSSRPLSKPKSKPNPKVITVKLTPKKRPSLVPAAAKKRVTN
ncbi:hypothetical protein RvY_08681 [Ramazzottius varieornatus]|uniref:Transcription factor CBF/NF-Y/archaeal histone domain-containing protein n=1 Tax=Ramazzottius varieornatus TaxID=947166 RepID=A0A1D1V6R1_RAMVA|nr:hypothetical protein RvY_08681 [Ramazzottius varieornatus]